MTKCSHRNKCHKIQEPKFGITYGSAVGGKYHEHEIPAFQGCIITICADCGEEIKRVLYPKISTV